MLTDKLVEGWGLSPDERLYIDRQQGTACARCHNNLRSMVLARTITGGSMLPLTAWLALRPWARILEINEAGELSRFLRPLPRHRIVRFPDVDMQNLPFDDGTFDLVLHSDTLEHVSDPVKGLTECRRVLRPRGRMCFTVPIIVGRMSRRRDGLAALYHGDENAFLVITEYGSDVWEQVMAAGFRACRLAAHEFPTAIAIEALP